MKNVPATCFLKDCDTAVVGEFDGIGEVFRHVESLLAAFFRLPWIVDVVEFQLAATELFKRRNGFFQRIMGDFGKDEIAILCGIAGPVLLGVLPSVYGYFFIPNYPSDIATVNFDRSGTTVIGKYLLNHSFMMPGLICVFTSTIVAYVLSMIFY